MTPAEFDARAFWSLGEALDLIPGERQKIRRWLNSAGVVSQNAGGLSIVTRSKLEGIMPEVLETMRRSVIAGYHS